MIKHSPSWYKWRSKVKRYEDTFHHTLRSMLRNDMDMLGMDFDKTLTDVDNLGEYDMNFDEAITSKDNIINYAHNSNVVIDDMKFYDYTNWLALMKGIELGNDYYIKLVKELTQSLMSGNTKKYKNVIERIRKESEGRITNKVHKNKHSARFWSGQRSVKEDTKYHTWKSANGDMNDYEAEASNHTKVIHLNCDIVDELNMMVKQMKQILMNDTADRNKRLKKLNNEIDKLGVAGQLTNEHIINSKVSKVLGVSIEELNGTLK